MAFKLESNEHIITIARRHWFKPVLESLFIFFSLLIPLVISSIVSALPNHSEQLGNVSVLSIIFILSWLFIVWNIGFIIWTNHFLDVLVVTNLHVIDIDQIGLWHREISTLQLPKIQDISSKTEGIIPSILNYGDLEIQTAGSLTNFIVKSIQRPDILRQKINEQINLLN
jgi:uncharacterized membrane protein YdbT with pleckstrin-like domain